MKYNTKTLVKYNLKTLSDKSKPFQIMLILVHKGQRLRYYTGKRIEEKNWDKSKQRAKTQYANASTLNAYLNTLANYVEDEYNKMLMSGEVITLDVIKKLIEIKQHRSTSGNFITHFDEFLDNYRTTKAKRTVDSYKTTKKRLTDFINDTGFNLNYNSVDLSFHDSYINYLITTKDHLNTTIAREIKRVKTFLNWATEKGYNKNLKYKKFKSKSDEGQIHFLTWTELIKLFEYDFKENDEFRKVRDIFCFGCFTGMRFSDIINLKHENIDGDYINIITIKTNSHCSIPLNQYSRTIYEKYKSKNGNVFENISNSKMNEILKKLGEEVKIDTPVLTMVKKGGERKEEYVPKHKILSSHIARKTFITNALEKGMKTEVIMDITTHKDFRTFKRYFKVVDEHKKNEMDKIFG